MNTNTKWISTNYRHIMFFNDVFTFEVEAKKANISFAVAYVDAKVQII